MKHMKLIKLVQTALFMAIICVATTFFKIPSPTGGYIHPGDAIVFLSGFVLGPLYGFAAASMGSALADFISGYPIYILPTFLIKGLVAVSTYYIYYNLSKIKKLNHYLRVILSTVISSFIILIGYFIFDSYIIGLGGLVGITSMYFNIIQCGFGVVVASLVYPVVGAIASDKNN